MVGACTSCFFETDLSMSSKRTSTPISDQDIRERLNRALLRFAANVQPAFYTDHETKFLSTWEVQGRDWSNSKGLRR